MAPIFFTLSVKAKAVLAAVVSFFTAETTQSVDVDGWIDSITGLLSEFSVGNLIKIIGGGLLVAIPFVIFWFAYRYISRKANKGMKKGGM